MTKVLKLLGGGLLAAILGIALSAAAFGLFSNDNGTSIAAPTFDRASAHVSLGAADLAPASSAAVPIRYLPGDINATSLTAYDADTSNPLNAFPVGLARAVDSLTAASLPFYDSLSPGASDLPTASGANDPNAKGIINSSHFSSETQRREPLPRVPHFTLETDYRCETGTHNKAPSFFSPSAVPSLF